VVSESSFDPVTLPGVLEQENEKLKRRVYDEEAMQIEKLTAYSFGFFCQDFGRDVGV
jgi:hypothetical protein